MDAFMGVSFIAFFFIIFAILILPTVFFLLTQQRALSKCSPANRTMTPGLVWLQIIPFFGFIWQFFVVLAVANSLENEFAARRIPEERKPGQSIGLAMCITRVCTVIPFLGIFAGDRLLGPVDRLLGEDRRLLAEAGLRARAAAFATALWGRLSGSADDRRGPIPRRCRAAAVRLTRNRSDTGRRSGAFGGRTSVDFGGRGPGGWAAGARDPISGAAQRLRELRSSDTRRRDVLCVVRRQG